MTVLEEMETVLRAAYDQQGPAVVGLGRGWGRGSGVIVARNRVLTAAHAVRADELTVTLGDGRTEPARVAGVDPQWGIAVLELETGDIEPVTWAGDAPPAPGQAVVALANPGGRGLRVTLGFLASVRRSLRGPRGRRIGAALEHTAPLPRGSAGGPLLDISGRLLGVNAVRAEGGLILALHADAGVRGHVEALAAGEVPHRARLGVAVAPPRAARALRRAVGLPERDGLLVRAVEDDSPAAAAGLRRGDLIVRAGTRETDTIDTLHDAMETAGATLDLGIVRGADEETVSVLLQRGGD